MVPFINKTTGTLMYVHESRVDEYKAAGHLPAAEEKPADAPKPKRTRKTAQK
jgi:hypothetical protein